MRTPAFETPVEKSPPLPDHTQLPDTDGSIVNNDLEHPQSYLLTASLRPKLSELHPDGKFFVACDVGVYFRYTEPVLAGCKSPDWYYVPGVGQMLDGRYRRSYVMWKEVLKPRLVVEYVSGDGEEEHDRTPNTGKFWVYEQAIRADYYAIYDVQIPSIELYHLEDGRYHPVSANADGRYPVPPMGVELGLWEGLFHSVTAPWLRAWDAATRKMLTIPEERTDDLEAGLEGTRELLDEQVAETAKERKRADEAARFADEAAQQFDEAARRADEATRQRDEAARQRDEAARQRDEAARQRDEASRRADEAARRADQLAARLRALGIDPEA